MTMRSMKKTKLTFGPFVKVPVAMYKATDDGDAEELDFHQHHGPDGPKACLGRIRYKRACEDCGAIVDYADIVRATEHDDKLVVVTDDEMDSLSDEVGPNIEIVQFSPDGQMDLMLLEGSSYYFAPDGDEDAYRLLREIMVDTKRVGIVRFVMRTKISMGLVRVAGQRLVMHRMMWADQIRDASGLPSGGEYHGKPPSAQELKIGRMLVDDLTFDFDANAYSDGKTARLKEFVAAKAKGQEPKIEKPVDLDAPSSSLLAQLEASVKVTHAQKKAPAKRRGKVA